MAKIDSAYTTLARQKSFMGITSTTNDTLLTRLILSATDFVKKYTRRDFFRQAYSNEQYHGTGTTKLVLKNYPIDSGETFSLQQRAPSWTDDVNGDWQTIDTDQYIVDYDKGIIHFQGVFAKGILNWRVSYTAGFYVPADNEFDDETDDEKDLPMDLEGAIWDLVSAYFNDRKTNKNIKSSRVRDISITYRSAVQKDEEMKRVLQFYRRFSYS
jgi:hypothetical protein